MDIIRKKVKRYLINKIPIRSFQETEHRTPFFIIGSGRNGSTLLSAILNNHTDIFIPPEQYALAHSILKWQYPIHKNWETKLQSSIDFFLSRCYNWKTTAPEAFTQLNNHLEKNCSFENFFYQLCSCESRQKNKAHLLLGDKTPYNTFYVPLLTKTFPTAPFIFLTRDPRDVAASLKRMNSEISLAEIIYRWQDSQQQLAYLLSKKKKVYVCTYEDFVQRPQSIIDEILDFLGVQIQENILSNYTLHLDTLGVSDASQHANIRNQINAQSVGKYKKELSPKEIEKLESVFSNYFLT